jgi:hypothetical protein
MDEILCRIPDKARHFYEVPESNQIYELYDPLTVMFFYRNNHMLCDFGAESAFLGESPQTPRARFARTSFTVTLRQKMEDEGPDTYEGVRVERGRGFWGDTPT